MSECPDCKHDRRSHWANGCMWCKCTQNIDDLAKYGLAQGQALREQGENLAGDAASEWRNLAYDWIAGLAPGTRFTATDLTHAVGMPPHLNAIGAVIHGSGKRGMTANTGEYVKSVRPNRHAGRNAVWIRRGST